MKRYKFDSVTNFMLDWFGGYVAWHNKDIVCYRFRNQNIPTSLKVKFSIGDCHWYMEHQVVLGGGKKAFVSRGSGRSLLSALDDLDNDENVLMACHRLQNGCVHEDTCMFTEGNKVISGLAGTIRFLSEYSRDRIDREFSYDGGVR